MSPGPDDRRAHGLRVLLVVAVILVAYLSSYLWCTVHGEYVGLPSGRVRYSSGMALMDAMVWVPAYGGSEVLTEVFHPVWLIDRWAWHHDRSLLDPSH